VRWLDLLRGVQISNEPAGWCRSWEGHVSGPRGGRWTASLILGNATRETGILRNRLYGGELVWNRQHFSKDPTTGRRVSRPNPRATWLVEPVEALRIIAPDLWDSVQARLLANRQIVLSATRTAEPTVGSAEVRTASRGGRLGIVRRAPWLLSGLVRCGLCNGPLSVMGAQGRLGCANQRERGLCDNRRSVLRAVLTNRVVEGLKQRLLSAELVEEFVRAFVTEVNAANQDRQRRRAGLTQEQAKLGRQIRIPPPGTAWSESLATLSW